MPRLLILIGAGCQVAFLGVLYAQSIPAVQRPPDVLWDSRVGSDDRTSCASCHVHAGADNCVRNQINPGTVGRDGSLHADATDFPFNRHMERDGNPIVSDVNDVVSLQGVFTVTFENSFRNGRADDWTDVPDDGFHGGSDFDIGGVNAQRVEPRNTPTPLACATMWRRPGR